MPVQCTEAEWKIMEVLWQDSPRTMSDITRALQAQTGWTRQTVITLLKRMQEKGSVRADEQGPIKTYAPAVSRQEACASQAKKLLSHAFGGQPALLINTLVDSGQLTLGEMQDILDMMRRKRKK